MTYFNLYNPGKADCAQVPPAVTSMRHYPPPQHWSSVSSASGSFQPGLLSREADLFIASPRTPSDLFIDFFPFTAKEVAPGAKQITVSVWVTLFFSRSSNFFSSSLHSSLFTMLLLTGAAALLLNELQKTAGASRLHLLTVCVFTLLVLVYFFIYSLGLCVSTAGESSCSITQSLMTQSLLSRAHFISNCCQLFWRWIGCFLTITCCKWNEPTKCCFFYAVNKNASAGHSKG